MQVLIVDDDPDDIGFLREALAVVNPSINTLHAHDGLQGFKVLQSQFPVVPQYIFLDLNMPIMSGKEFLYLAKKEVSLQKVPIVIYSTSNNEKEIKECFKMGAQFYLVKATKMSELINDLRTILFPNKLSMN